PLLGFFRNALSVLAGRQREHFAAKLGKACLDRRVGEGGVDLPVERVDDFGRRVLRRADTRPRARLETRHEVAQCGAVGKPLSVTAKGRSLPALICSMEEGMLSNMTCTCPPMRSVSAGGAPR